MRRYRHIAEMPHHGGEACLSQGSEETVGCPRQCGATTYCSWLPWGDWEYCPEECVTKVTRRERRLHATDSLEMEKAFEALELKSSAVKVSRHKEMMVSFACGLLTFVAGHCVVKVVRFASRS